jgi:hypothetical protein
MKIVVGEWYTVIMIAPKLCIRLACSCDEISGFEVSLARPDVKLPKVH